MEEEPSTIYLDIPSESPRRPRTSPLMSPKMPVGKNLVRSLSLDGGAAAANTSVENVTSQGRQPNAAQPPVSVSFDVKFKGHKTWTITTRVDLGPEVHDEARFRDAVAEVSWADIEAFSREIGVSLPPGLHILLPALRGGLIRRWLELVAVERGLNAVLHFLHADDVMRFPPRLNRVFSRVFDEIPTEDHLILG